MRNLAAIIDEILCLIPNEETYRKFGLETHGDLVTTLKEIQRSIPYKAPEALHELWYEVSTALNEYLPPLTRDAPEWCQKIADVFAGPDITRDDELRVIVHRLNGVVSIILSQINPMHHLLEDFVGSYKAIYSELCKKLTIPE